jgi:hypothetical protein
MSEQKHSIPEIAATFREKETALRAAKEIAVKFIECGKISPDSFAGMFPEIYVTILDTLRRDGK